LEFISTIQFEARTINIQILEAWHLSFSHAMQYIVNMLQNMWMTKDDTNEHSGISFRLAVDIFSKVTNSLMYWPGTLIARQLGQMCIVDRPYGLHNHRPSLMIILCMLL